MVTRALRQTPAPKVDLADTEESFHWVLRPRSTISGQCTVYIDGSRLFGEHELYGMCARHGWAFSIFDELNMLVAAAHGRPPSWAEGIHGAELWGLLQAASSSGPEDLLKVDCLAVKLGAHRGCEWAMAPCRKLGRAWGPLSLILEGDARRVIWMPAHCRVSQAGSKLMSNGLPITVRDINGNKLVDSGAKAIARREKPPKQQIAFVKKEGQLVREAAMWLGKITALANHFPNPAWSEGQDRKSKFLRDSQGCRANVKKSENRKRKQPDVEPRVPGDLSSCPRWAAIRARICARCMATPTNPSGGWSPVAQAEPTDSGVSLQPLRQVVSCAPCTWAAVAVSE